VPSETPDCERGDMTTIQVEHLSGVKKKVTFEVPEEKVREIIDAQFKDLRKDVQIKGFRKGKVPLDIIRGYFKKDVLAEAARKIIEETFESGLEEHDLKPIKVINVSQDDVTEGKPFTYVTEIEVQPRIEATGYTGLKLTKNLYPVTEEQVQERLQALRQRNARLSPLREPRGIAPKDWVYLDIEARIDGEVVKDLTVNDYPVELGRDFYVAGFDSLIEGMRVDETRDLTMTLPEDFRIKELSGKTAEFKVTVKDAKEYVLPELDDDFAKDLGDYQTLDALVVDLRDSLRKRADIRSRKELESEIVDLLITANPVEIPETLIEAQIDTVIGETADYVVARGMDPKQIPPPSKEMRDSMRPNATRAVHAGLIIQAVGDREKLEVSDEEFDAELAQRAKDLGISPDYLKDSAAEHNILSDLRGRLVEEKVFRFIQENSEVNEVEKSEGQSAPPTDTETA
jgi:trigger factor